MVTILYKCDMCGKVVLTENFDLKSDVVPILTDKLNEITVKGNTVEICSDCEDELEDEMNEIFKRKQKELKQ